MHTKRFKTQASTLGQYGRQWVGKHVKRDRRKLFSFSTKGLRNWQRVPKSAKMF